VLYEDASVLKSGRGMDIDELYINTFKEM